MNYKEEVLQVYPNAKCVKLRIKTYQIRHDVPKEQSITHAASLSYIRTTITEAWKSAYEELIIDILWELTNR